MCNCYSYCPVCISSWQDELNCDVAAGVECTWIIWVVPADRQNTKASTQSVHARMVLRGLLGAVLPKV